MTDEQNKDEPKADDPKIIVDEDWKTQVKKEKEQLKSQVDSDTKSESEPQLPAASFPMLLSTLATQVMSALGQMPDPVDGKSRINKPLAKHLVDTIAMLEEKTKGNLSDDEAQMMDTLLHEVRMIYVSVKAPAGGEEEEPPKSKIELP